nr:nicotinamide phosphoribosyltransferase domain-containing protein [Zavarzinella formosa]
MKLNPLNCIDFYKADHRRQYPEGTTLVYSNFTPRSGKLSNIPEHLFNGRVVFFGLQYFIKHFLIETWNTEFFAKPKEEVVARYKRRMDTSLGKDAIPVEHIEALHDLGYLPICIKALPEGSSVPIKVPALVIYNTHPDFFWLTNYLETVLSCYLWKPMTSATIARHYRTLLERYALETGTDAGFVQFQAHDFSFRGLSGVTDAALSGAAHLTSFVGTDTVAAIDLIEDYYNGDAEKELIGCSVLATEHSVACLSSCHFGGDVSMVEEAYDEVSGEWNRIAYLTNDKAM